MFTFAMHRGIKTIKISQVRRSSKAEFSESTVSLRGLGKLGRCGKGRGEISSWSPVLLLLHVGTALSLWLVFMWHQAHSQGSSKAFQQALNRKLHLYSRGVELGRKNS